MLFVRTLMVAKGPPGRSPGGPCRCGGVRLYRVPDRSGLTAAASSRSAPNQPRPGRVRRPVGDLAGPGLRRGIRAHPPGLPRRARPSRRPASRARRRPPRFGRMPTARGPPRRASERRVRGAPLPSSPCRPERGRDGRRRIRRRRTIRAARSCRPARLSATGAPRAASRSADRRRDPTHRWR